ncbi:efflux RND transporter periplasmic adaptor subunit [Blastopirellula marina]|uniref:Hemolysin D n=1 Tax=Blastopirellula marina TaxID=124 RepID=A0A2S8GC02_9BACT|nr:efflux RND transporter periplasmic adaptor subunit [Blastopirellula marina]PQO41953.1 hemolysin D [Blastopirellula marina]PTL46310.1 efflux RND transporter periplasmic adaptor subunit [Blastopirellula marina]
MSNPPVDLRQLAIERSSSEQPKVYPRQQLLTRYLLPGLLAGGFLSLVMWASWEMIFPPTPVTVVSVISSTADVQHEGTTLFQAAGWIEPRPTLVRVAALAPGVVESLLVVEDQVVKSGEPIARLVKEDSQLAYRKALAELELRKAEVQEANAVLHAATVRLANPVHLESALGEAEAEVAKLDTQLNSLPFEIRRAEAMHQAASESHEGKMRAGAAVPGISIVKAKYERDSALAHLEDLKGKLSSLQKEQTALTQRRDALQTQLNLLIDETRAKQEAEAQIAAAKSRVSQAEIAVAEAKLKLDRMTIFSPIDGRVFRLIAQPGTSLSPGIGQMPGYDASTVVTMYDPKQLQVRVDIRFEDIPKVTLGQPVEINNPAMASPMTGRVLFISSEADIQKNTLQVKVEIPDPQSFFKPEMLVDVKFLAPKVSASQREPSEELKLFVPQHLVHRSASETFVWIADRSDAVARRVPVEASHAHANGLVEVTRGLTLTSRVIASGIEQLSDGDRIRVIGGSPTSNFDQTRRLDSPQENQ